MESNVILCTLDNMEIKKKNGAQGWKIRYSKIGNDSSHKIMVMVEVPFT